jgi:hypothetical protein
MLDEGETLMRQEDVLIQCGTNHAWSLGPSLWREF